MRKNIFVIFTILFNIALFHSDVHSATLEALWEFDGDFTASNDSANDGTAFGTVNFVSGQVGQAAEFDGGVAHNVNSNSILIDHVDSQKTTPASYFGSGLSVMGWINPDAAAFGGGRFISHHETCCSISKHGFNTGLDSAGMLEMSIRDASGGIMYIETIDIISVGTWNHVAVTWDGSTTGGLTAFINGQEVSSTIGFQGGFQGLNGSGALPVRLGSGFADSGNNMYGFDGSIDHMSIWRGELTSTEVLADYQATVVPEPISSTLFIVGGATLGFRRFRKKFKK